MADDRLNWRPQHFETGLWGTSNRFEFATVKLLDYSDDLDHLESSENPFAQVVLAHLRTIQTAADDSQRGAFKFQLFRLLYEKAYSRKMIMDLMVFIDWVMVLTPLLNEKFVQEITQFDEEQKMKYIPTWSRDSFKEGKETGVSKGRETLQQAIFDTLEVRFSNLPAEIESAIIAIDDIEELGRLVPIAATIDSLTAFEAELK
ncbi:MAG: hypothetical protein AAF633_00695 [Chloroflexota bacterium]